MSNNDMECPLFLKRKKMSVCVLRTFLVWFVSIAVTSIPFTSVVSYFESLALANHAPVILEEDVSDKFVFNVEDINYLIGFGIEESKKYYEEEKRKQKGQDAQSNDSKKKSHFAILMLYIFLYLLLNVQVTLFILTLFSETSLPERCFYLSDWAVNSAPIVGVMGTIISFSFYFSEVDVSNLNEVFSKNFIDAATTTIVGGFVYVVNLLLNVFIAPKIFSPNN